MLGLAFAPGLSAPSPGPFKSTPGPGLLGMHVALSCSTRDAQVSGNMCTGTTGLGKGRSMAPFGSNWGLSLWGREPMLNLFEALVFSKSKSKQRRESNGGILLFIQSVRL